MNQLKKRYVLFYIIHALFAHIPNTECTFGKPFFASRSQGNNLARRLVGEVNELLHCGSKHKNGIFSITPEWSQNFHRNRLGNYFSIHNGFNNESNTMTFRGSMAQNPPFSPTNTDILAENFLLPSTFSGAVTLFPHIENFITDINFRLNLYNRLPGLYVEVGLPIAWTRSHVALHEETPAFAGTDIAILASNNPIKGPYVTTAPFTTITEAFTGAHVTQEFTFTAPGVAPIAIGIENMRFGLIDGKKTKSGVADIELVLGYNVLCKPKYHLDFNIRVTVPTGNRPEAVYMFEPIIGGGHHLQIGGGLSAHGKVWSNGCDRSWSIWFDSALYYAFNTKQRRTFDLLNNGVGSRYLLFKQFNEAGNFANRFVPGPNITTLDAKVGIGLIGQAVLLVDYQRKGLTIDFGYSAWGREKEKIKLTQEIEQATFGIWGGTPIDNLIPGAANRTNSQVLINGENFISATNQEFDTPSPSFISNNNIDVASAESPAALSHMLFAHVCYAWPRKHCTPFIGAGGQVEFSGKENNALTQWGIWGKVGLAFF